MKNLFTILVLSFTVLGTVAAQQPAQYSLYMLNKFNFNPAYAGLDNSISFTGIYRKQWVGIPGSPETQNLNVHLPLYMFSGGAGFSIENETLGNWRQTSVLFSYNYQLKLKGAGILSLGVSGGLLQRTLDGTKIRTPGGNYGEELNEINHNESILQLPISEITGSSPSFNFGVYFQGEKFEAGVSVLNLTEQAIDLNTLQFKPNRSFFLNAGYNFEISKKLVLYPSVLVKSNVTETQIDFSALFKYNDNFFGGASYRGYSSNSTDAVAIIAGFKLSEKITLAYSYDLTLSKLNTVSNGSHEILLNYNFGKAIGKGKPPKIIYNPRNL